jgi:hypothetical protein
VRCEAARAGPWSYDPGSGTRHEPPTILYEIKEAGEGYDKGDLESLLAWLTPEDGAAIAHARTDLPLALDALDKADAEAERLKEECSDLQDDLTAWNLMRGRLEEWTLAWCAEDPVGRVLTRPDFMNLIRWQVARQARSEVERLKAERDRLLDMTQELDQHPNYYDGPCKCRACREAKNKRSET